MNVFNFSEIQRKIKQTNEELMILLSKQSQNYFFNSWRQHGFEGVKWKEVQRRKPETKAYKYPKTKGLQRQTKPILVGAGFGKRGGTLRRAVSNMSNTAQISTGRVRMVVDLPYANIHNEGGVGKAFGKHEFKMPKRQFVGQTKELTDKQTKLISKTIDKLWQD